MHGAVEVLSRVTRPPSDAATAFCGGARANRINGR